MDCQDCVNILKSQGKKNCSWLDDESLVRGIEEWKANNGQNYIGFNIRGSDNGEFVILKDFMVDGSARVQGEIEMDNISWFKC